MKSTILDYKEIVDSYVKVEDWACKRKFYCHVFSRGTDPEQLRSSYGKLLAV